MSNPLPHLHVQDIECYKQMFRQFPWELSVTTRIPSDIDTGSAHKQLVHQILAPLSSHLDQKLSAVSVVVPATATTDGNKPAHIHTLCLSFEGDLAAKHDDIQAFLLDNIQQGTMLENSNACVIKAIDDTAYYQHATAYLAKNFASTTDATLHHFKKRLLIKRMCESACNNDPLLA